jgi:hypothetical protein
LKHCPECNFSFPDFHRVCDFDGTELVPSPEREPLVAAKSSPSSRFQRGFKSPVVWAGLLLIGVLSSAFLVAYYDATGRSAQLLTPAQDQPASTEPLPASDQPAQVEPSVATSRNATIKSTRAARTPSAIARRQAPASRSIGSRARVDQKRLRVRTQKPEIARRGDAQKGSPEKQSKLTAVLKTTWRVVKWPFNF